ncbi:hypothetical protein BEN47_04170 [Hymenobacter lapidarius]|uniref:Energy transducer TonB n=2 Tax=Hymenobacter lapidarius TaxID=1908237 RepID=A0A1G1SVD7_9BACT|nr:hypothetical protein BEN47_04170 [Hymenobacter lapidarius]
MDNSQIAKASLNDIVFEGRNKAYGAYVLRRLYQRHVTRALIIATALFLLLISFPLISQYLKDKMPKEPKKNLQENVLMDAPPLDETKPPPPPAPRVVCQHPANGLAVGEVQVLGRVKHRGYLIGHGPDVHRLVAVQLRGQIQKLPREAGINNFK